MFEINVFLRDKLIGRSVFSTEEVRIGRAADNEIQIDNLAFSRYHASIEDVSGVYILKDFGGQNGTFVNGQKIEGRFGLNDNDRIQIGKFTLVFRSERRGPVSAKVTNEAAYAVAGQTIVTKAPEVRERSCPYIAFLESVPNTTMEPPQIHHLGKDIFIVGSAAGSDLLLDPKQCPPRAAAFIRGWSGFQLLALGPGVVRNQVPVDLRSDLGRGDQLTFGTVTFRYQVGRTDAGA